MWYLVGGFHGRKMIWTSIGKRGRALLAAPQESGAVQEGEEGMLLSGTSAEL